MAMTVVFHELGGPEVMSLEEVEVGEPGPGELRIRVEAIGLNRAEVLFRSGHYIEPVAAFPARLGTEAAGVVEAVGAGVTGFRPGQPVSTVPGFSQNEYGVYAEQAIVPASAVLPRPEGLGAVEGAAVWMPYLTAYGALVEVGGMRPGDTVVLNAASSSVGLAAIHVADRVGATPIALTRTAAKKEALLKEGAAEVIVTESDDVAGRVLAATGGRGAEFVFDAVAGPGVTDLARLVAPGGSLLVYGALSGEPTPYPGIELGLPALNMRTYTMLETARDPERLRRAAAFVTSGLRSGAFRPVIDRTFPLSEMADAHRHLESNTQVGKIVVTVPR
ncbi:NADPH:quinone reductase-like Zn-dependent oxidoreductase [Actinomadura coerulea]|uniref:NADPH:quinone reductase-like Zn-dependent oxidoreductase n=1 Tax=Actinomadura coerulea TaxID=46159 RepID=A0A7X0G4P3_9ACTN|nr:zinc-dependent alcohol dehydrogenase family protein [Actinomadura coerulea]MBB6399194.1 NADPH:quinone reductase-like Zn-dependent oxidoreductase [Actinomadura coerulea]GGQ24049.1 NADPH:quinone reductase [Actinomadura coerulea]